MGKLLHCPARKEKLTHTTVRETDILAGSYPGSSFSVFVCVCVCGGGGGGSLALSQAQPAGKTFLDISFQSVEEKNRL